MKKLLQQTGSIHTLPLLLIVVAVGIVSYLLVSSTAPFKGGLFGNLNPKPQSQAAISNVIDMAYPCGFTNPAFCDNFSEGPAPVKGRANDLDFRKWAFSRISGAGGWGTIEFEEHCKQTLNNVPPDQDSFMCGSEVPEPEHWMEAVDDRDSFVYNDARIRQPFDFTNRTGTIQFGVDAKTSGGHGWWLETWITDAPTQGLSGHDAGGLGTTSSKYAIAFDFAGGCGAEANPPSDFFNHGYGMMNTVKAMIFRDYQYSDTYNSSDPTVGQSVGCVKTQDDLQNMIQIRLSQTHAEIWASDAGSNVLHQIFVTDIKPPLPFSVGYVNFVHTHYNPSKADNFPGGASFYQTYHWHDMGFDGPIHPTPRAYEIPDSLVPGETNRVNTYYLVNSDGTINDTGSKNFPSFTFKNVDLSGMSSAKLNLSLHSFDTPGFQMQYQFNNSPIHTYNFPSTVTWGPGLNWAPSLDVALSDLQNGDNTLKLKFITNGSTYPNGLNSGEPSNIDLELSPTDSSISAPAVGMISCNLMNLMMGVMPTMVMTANDPCSNNPLVGFNQPAQGVSFIAPASIPVAVTASPKGSATSISKVVLMQGSTTLATLTSAPYNFTWNNVAAGNYVLTATATDNLGQTGMGQINVNVVPAYPVVSATTSSNVTTNTATITWVTDKPGDSSVDYGQTNTYGFSSPVNSSQVTAHSITLSGLTPGTSYHYRAKSSNSSGTGTSSDFTFTTQVPIPPTNVAFTGEYWNYTGSPAVPTTTATVTRIDNGINFDFGQTPPPSPVVGTNLVVRWTGTLNVPTSATYIFAPTVDDGVRLYIDGALLIDQWHDQAATTYTGSKALAAGNHQIEMEYYQGGGGAVAKLTWFVQGATSTPTPTLTPTPSPTPTPTPTPGTCPKKTLGDIDCDNTIGIFDFNTLVTNFGKTGTGLQGDLDGNGKVDIFDFNTLVTNFGH